MSELTTVLDVRVVNGSGGGPDKTILNSPRHLTNSGYRMLCAYLRSPADSGFDALRQKAIRTVAPLVEISDKGPLDWRVIPQLLHICRSERIRIWHGHDYKSNLLGLILSQFWPMRLVTTVHGWVKRTWKTPLYYAVDQLCLRFYERVFCVSDDLVQRCRAIGIASTQCLLLENGIDTIEFQRRQTITEAQSRLGIPTNRRVIGGVGRLSPEKGFDKLIAATAQLTRRGHDVEALIVGEGEERERLVQIAAEQGIADRVRLVGYQADPRPFYEAMNVFALSSVREGLPNVLLEAMALKVPCVASAIAGVPRLLNDNRAGLLVPPGDSAILTAAVESLLNSPERAVALSQVARQTVESQFSFAARMRTLSHHYDALLRDHS